jgi:hypothetical protein
MNSAHRGHYHWTSDDRTRVKMKMTTDRGDANQNRSLLYLTFKTFCVKTVNITLARTIWLRTQLSTQKDLKQGSKLNKLYMTLLNLHLLCVVTLNIAAIILLVWLFITYIYLLAYLSISPIVQTGSGVHPTSYTMGTGGSFPGGKAAGAWSWPRTSS